MEFAQEELMVIFSALSFTDDGKVRMFANVALPDVASIMGKLKKLADKEGKLPEKGGKVELSTDEKKLTKDSIEARQWGAQDAEHVLNVISKLS